MASDLQVRQRRLLPASRQRVWNAWTDPQLMLRWFSPLGMTTTEAECDLQIGGAFRITMQVAPNMQTIIPQHNGMVVASGTYEEIAEPSLLVFSWGWKGHDEVSRVTIKLEAQGESTELVLLHQQLTTVESQTFHDEGWSLTFDHLHETLSRVPSI